MKEIDAGEAVVAAASVVAASAGAVVATVAKSVEE